jgi:hypothetical protein
MVFRWACSITPLFAFLFCQQLLCAAEPLPANWAEKLFERTEFDLGVVARGVGVQQVIRVTNPFDVPIRLLAWRSNIGLSVAGFSKPRTLAPGESTDLTVWVETTKYVRSKKSLLTIQFDQPNYAEVQIDVTWYVRTDVVLQPGQVRVPPLARGESATTLAKISAIVRTGWKVVSASCENPAIVPSLKETRRERAEGDLERIEYELTVTTRSDAQSGESSPSIRLQLSDQKTPVSLPVVFANAEGEKPLFGPSLEYLWTFRPSDGVDPPEPGIVFCIQAAGNLPWERRLFAVSGARLAGDVLPKVAAGTLKMDDPAILYHATAPPREVAFHRFDLDGDGTDEVLLTGRGGAGGTAFLNVFQIAGERVKCLYDDTSRFDIILLDENGDGRFEIANAGFEFQTDDSHVLNEKDFTVYRLQDEKYVESRRLSAQAMHELTSRLEEGTGGPLAWPKAATVLRVYRAPRKTTQP